MFKKMENHEIDTWDYQWTYSIFKNDGVCINPARNFITNIGFNSDATHTTIEDSSRNNQRRYEIGLLKHPGKIRINNLYIKKINKYDLGISTLEYYKMLVIKLMKNSKEKLKDLRINYFKLWL